MGDQVVANVVDAILTAILQWRVAWLEEQIDNPNPPPICRSEPKKLKITYDSYKDYESTFVPLIMHEIWAQIFDEWLRIYNQGITLMDSDNPPPPEVFSKGNSVPREFYVGVVDYRTEAQFQCNLRCQYIVDNKKLASHLKMVSEGDLVKLDLIVDQDVPSTSSSNRNQTELKIDPIRKQNVLSLFAYVIDVSSERIHKYTQLAECFQLNNHVGKHHNVINYQIVIAKRPLRLKQSELMKLTGLYYLKPMIRQIESVANLRESQLASDILCPSLLTCQLALPTVVDIKSPNYNDAQYKAIVGSNEAMMRNMPKIQLIQGPPGTGKTHTLIGIIKNFYLNWRDSRMPKILICAPSNGAIDEVAKRLHKEREFLKKNPKVTRSLRMVRVGHPDHISPDVKAISLEELIETNANNKVNLVKKRQIAKIKDLELEMRKCDIEISNLRAKRRENDIRGLEMKIHELQKQVKACKAAEDINSKRESSEAAKKNMRYELIKNADVILTTLNSCQRHPLDVIFKNHASELQFHCVIVDEACQCSEPEVLMPLCYKISKFILIGDPMQLPATVISRTSQVYDYGRSLFERIFIHFGRYSSVSPVAMLTEQYRMHPAICQFPSKQFYDNRLITSRRVLELYPLKPYILFDLRHSKESRTGGKTIENEVEASFVRNLITAVVSNAPENSKIGVITPYKGQKRLISHKINDLKTVRKISVDVDTCDGFQGQEKDIIILSCVRAMDTKSSSIGFLKSFQRMNVALTRAKHSLLVIVSANSLKSDKIWSALIDNAMGRRAFQSYTSTPSVSTLERMVANDGMCMLEPRDKNSESNGDELISDAGNFTPEYVIPMDID